MNDIIAKTGKLTGGGKLAEAEEYLMSCYKKAKEDGDNATLLTVLNEQAGLYRDTGKHDKAVASCIESEKILDAMGVGNTKERAASLLNLANAYRASGDADEAYKAYKKAYAVIEICGDDNLYSSYYNNMALLHQTADRFDDAADCLEKALRIVRDEMHDEIRCAITETNLAGTYLRLKKKEEAKANLLDALKIFGGRTPSDFHYSAALSAMGDLSLLNGEFEKSVMYFEMALAEIKLHMGENDFYKIVSDNLDNAYEILARKKRTEGEECTKESLRNVKGLDLCEKYYRAFGEPVIEKNFGSILDNIACGMVGAGSECLGYDDDISPDHDFGPGFCIFINDSVSEEDEKRLKKMYELLPKSFMGKERLETVEGRGRVGVIRVKDFLKSATGFDHVPKGPAEWQYTVDENLITFVNGRIFTDRSGFMGMLRKHIKKDQPAYVHLKKLSIQLELMAKHGQYSFERALKRSDLTAAFIAKGEFLKATMRTVNLMNNKYAPYAKWLRRSLDDISGTEKIKKLIDKLSKSAVSEKDITVIEDICTLVRNGLKSRGLAYSEESFLKVQAYEISALAMRTLTADRIVDLEWDLFDKVKNEGGRADCQDNWGTFSIMRRSQYYTWPEELLTTLLADFEEKAKNGRNVITEKYGYMMESTVPDEFGEIKDKLPEISEQKKQVMEAIIGIQVGWMEEFAKGHPKMATNARAIHTKDDTPYMTSYETYLRGELSTYDDETLKMYGQFIVTLYNNGDNLAEKIMTITSYYYGYESVEACEKALSKL